MPTEKRTNQRSFRAPAELMAALGAYAVARGVTVNGTIVLAIKEYLDRQVEPEGVER